MEDKKLSLFLFPTEEQKHYGRQWKGMERFQTVFTDSGVKKSGFSQILSSGKDLKSLVYVLYISICVESCAIMSVCVVLFASGT